MDQQSPDAMQDALGRALGHLRAARQAPDWPGSILRFALELTNTDTGAAFGRDAAILARGRDHGGEGSLALAEAASAAITAGSVRMATDAGRTAFALPAPFGAVAVSLIVTSPMHASLTRERLQMLAAQVALIEDVARSSLGGLLAAALAAAFAAPTQALALHAAAHVLAEATRAHRVAIGVARRGRITAIGLSDQADIAFGSELGRRLKAALEAALDGHAPPQSERPITVAAHGGLAVLVENDVVAAQPLVDQLARGLAPVAEFRGTAPKTRKQRPVTTIALVLAAVTGVAAIVPHAAEVEAPFVLEPRVKHAVTAPFDALLEASTVQPGDTVQRDVTVLARLSTREQELELSSARAKAASERREADLARVRGNPANEELAALAAQRTEAQVELLSYRIGLATIRAPADGTIINGDLRRSLGQPVGRGQLMFEIADPSDLRAEILVLDEHALKLADGQHAVLAPAAEPDRRIPVTLERVQPMTEMVQGRNVVRALAKLQTTEDSGWMKPGMEGQARIEVGQTSVLMWAVGDLVRLMRARFWI